MINTLQFAITTAAVGASIPHNSIYPCAVQAVILGTGAVTGTVLIEGSNDGVNWISPLTTLSLTGTTTDTKGAVITVPYAYLRSNLTAITGTSAAVTVLLNN